MSDLLIVIIFSVIGSIIVFALWVNIFGSRGVDEEIKRNELTQAPDDNQIKWHVQHMRQDIMSITKILFYILVILLFIVAIQLKVFVNTIF